MQNLSKLTQIIIGLWLIYQFIIFTKESYESIEIANRAINIKGKIIAPFCQRDWLIDIYVTIKVLQIVLIKL